VSLQQWAMEQIMAKKSAAKPSIYDSYIFEPSTELLWLLQDAAFCA